MPAIRINGFVQFRRGLFDHLFNGHVSHGEYLLYTVILGQADPATGIWEGSAEVLAQWLHLSTRTCRFQLAKLERKGYIKRFPTPGKNGSYPIFVHNFECSDLAMKGKRLNAAKSTSSSRPVYDDCRDIAGTLPPPLPPFNRDTKKLREEEKPRARGPSTNTNGNGYNHTRKSRPTDAWMTKPPEPGETDAMMAIASKRVAEGKPVDEETLRNVRAWDQRKARLASKASQEGAS